MDSSLPSLNTVRVLHSKCMLPPVSVLVVILAALMPPVDAAMELLPAAELGETVISGIPEPTTALLGIFGLCLIIFRRGRN